MSPLTPRIPLIRIIILLLVVYVSSLSCSVNYKYRMALSSYQMGEFHKSVNSLRKVYRVSKNRDQKAQLQFKIGEAYFHYGQYPSAESYYRSGMIRAVPTLPIAIHYGDVLLSNGKHEEAINLFKSVLDTLPTCELARNGLESALNAKNWLSTPSRYRIESMREINSSSNDFAAVYTSQQMNEIIFTSDRKGGTSKRKSAITGEYNADIYRTTFNMQKDRWNTPTLIDDQQMINTLADEGAISFNPQGNLLYFTRCSSDKNAESTAEIIQVTQLSGVWADPKKAFPDTTMAAHPSLSPDGKTLYFVSDRRGGYGGKDIWYSTLTKDNKWSKAINAGPEINTTGDELFPFIRDNGNLYFASNGHPGMGGLDLFVAQKSGDHWKVENMRAPINSPGDDFAISFLPGQDRGLFSSNRQESRKDDIYSFILPPKVYEVSGEIVSKSTGKRIDQASVRLIGTDGTLLKIDVRDGRYRFKLKEETDYLMAAMSKGYLNSKLELTTKGFEEGKSFVEKFELSPMDQTITVDNIHYEFGKWDLLPESVTSLDSLVSVLTSNPTVVIELMAHTDCRGDEATNMEVSQKRAQSVVNYLIAKGIQPGRMVAKGYGKSSPKKVNAQLARQYPFLKPGTLLDCPFIDKLQDETQREICHQINRRTEFRVVSNDYKEQFKN